MSTMRLWVGVENFAKIESAKICINNYTVLVGENNSGKTFLMQLASGVGEKLGYIIDDKIRDIIITDNMKDTGCYIISEDNISKIVEYFNEKLNEMKERLVYEIFRKQIPVEKLYVDITFEETEAYEVYDCNQTEIWKERLYTLLPKTNHDGIIHFLERNSVSKAVALQTNKKTGQSQIVSALRSTVEEKILPLVLEGIFHKETLFLPASRTGLILLYRDFFANRADQTIALNSMDQIEGKRSIQAEFTLPVYNFLRFLQTYKEEDAAKRQFGKEIRFFEEKLISGHINVTEQGTFSYRSSENATDIPMYLASSMINEIAPLVLALTRMRPTQRLVIDEVESSLHPEKQSELVRFLNRLNNKGIQMIISTHSDTIASKINNLYLLSKYAKSHGQEETQEMLKKFELEKEDLIEPDNLFIYEMLNQPNGKSVVREVKRDRENGFQFDQFTKSAMKIYDEATRIGVLMHDGSQTEV